MATPIEIETANGVVRGGEFGGMFVSGEYGFDMAVIETHQLDGDVDRMHFKNPLACAAELSILASAADPYVYPRLPWAA